MRGETKVRERMRKKRNLKEIKEMKKIKKGTKNMEKESARKLYRKGNDKR